MRAVLLAAGRGKRLGIDGPKCLLSVAGRSLIERHLDCLQAAGVSHVTVVMGHAHEQLTVALQVIGDARRALGKPLGIEVEPLLNDLYEHGSLVSLQRGIGRLREAGGLWMDADVLYPARLLRRLVESPHDSCVLLDGRSSEQGEEMMLAVQGDRVTRIARRVGSDWDLVGESVGFFKVGREGAEVLQGILDREVAEGRLDQEHEAALDLALSQVPFGHERVDDLPWTEIDFPDDVHKAEQLAIQVDAPV